jgi:hypothetical protein
MHCKIIPYISVASTVAVPLESHQSEKLVDADNVPYVTDSVPISFTAEKLSVPSNKQILGFSDGIYLKYRSWHLVTELPRVTGFPSASSTVSNIIHPIISASIPLLNSTYPIATLSEFGIEYSESILPFLSAIHLSKLVTINTLFFMFRFVF